MNGSDVMIETPALVLIGAQKAATSWLAATLQQHEAFHFSFLKEVHHFSRTTGQGADDWQCGRVMDKAADRRRRNLFGFRRRRYLRHVSRPETIGTDAWYRDMFHHHPEIVRRQRREQPVVICDFTPHYMTMSPEQFDHIPRLLPAAQLLLVIRDPLERMVSGLSMSLSRRPGILHHDLDERLRFLVRTQQDRGDYRHAVTQLKRLNLPHHIVAFRDMLDQPESLIHTLERSFGLPHCPMKIEAGKKRNSHSGKFDLPAELLDRMKTLCTPQYDFLRKEFGQVFMERI